MKKLITLTALLSLMSCSTSDVAGCNCSEIVEDATSQTNYTTWNYVKTLPTSYNCSENGYNWISTQFQNNSFVPPITVKERHRVECK